MIDNFEQAKNGGSHIGSGHFGRIRVTLNQMRRERLKTSGSVDDDKIIMIVPKPLHAHTGAVFLSLEEAAQLVKELSERIVYADDVINGRLDK